MSQGVGASQSLVCPTMRLVVGVVVAALLGSTAALAGPKGKPTTQPRLPPALEQRVQAHQETARRAKGSTDQLCKLVEDSYELVNPLEIALIDLTKGVSDRTEQRLWDNLDKRVTGTYFAMCPEFTRSGVDYAELSRMARGADAALLLSIAELDGVSQGIENVPGWLEAMNDFSGCHSPPRATPAMTALARSWPAASPCLRAALIKPLDVLLEEMAMTDAFCQWIAVPQRIAGARENAARMRELKGTRGPSLANELVKRAEASANPPPPAPR